MVIQVYFFIYKDELKLVYWSERCGMHVVTSCQTHSNSVFRVYCLPDLRCFGLYAETLLLSQNIVGKQNIHVRNKIDKQINTPIYQYYNICAKTWSYESRPLTEGAYLLLFHVRLLEVQEASQRFPIREQLKCVVYLLKWKLMRDELV